MRFRLAHWVSSGAAAVQLVLVAHLGHYLLYDSKYCA